MAECNTTQQLFAQRLTAARTNLEMSQEQLSRRSGVPASQISHYESGRRGPSIANLAKMISAMPGLDANWLLGIEEEPSALDYKSGYSDALRDVQAATLELDMRLACGSLPDADTREG